MIQVNEEQQENEKKELTLMEKIDLILKNQEEMKELLKRKRSASPNTKYVKIRAYILSESEKAFLLFNDRNQQAWVPKGQIKPSTTHDTKSDKLQEFWVSSWIASQYFPLEKKEDKNAKK